MNALFSGLRFFCICSVLMTVFCTSDRLAGGGTIETTNGLVAGKVMYPNGYPAPKSLVKLIPESYDPFRDTVTIPIDTTDDSGKYVFTGVSYGVYTIQSVQCVDRTRAIAFGINLNQDALSVSSMELQRPGAVKVMLPGGAPAATACVYVPGSDIATRVQGAGDSVILDSVPAGKLPSVNYLPENDAPSSVIRYDVQVFSGDTVALLNPSWRYARPVTLNTTPSGADVRGNVTGFPALVRLSSGNFTFAQARANGEDVRFTKTDGAPLPFEIEKWDSGNAVAAIWVRVDTVYGNNGAQSIMLYWGNASASAATNSPAVFDTTASKGGFQGVWHMGQAGNTLAKDATINGYDGTPFNMTAASAVPGMIGFAQEFDGASSYIQMSNTSSGKLNFPENGFYSVSAWVNCNTSNLTQFVAGKGHEQYYLKFNLSIGWEFVEWKDNSGPQITSSPLPEIKTWKYFVGVRNGTSQELYVDGTRIDSTIYDFPDTVPRNSQSDFSIGAYLTYVLTAVNEGYCFFNGKIDEVRVSNIILSADWIKLSYMNQKTPDALITW